METTTTDIEAKRQLLRGVDSFNAWRRSNPDVEIRLSRLVLTPESVGSGPLLDVKSGLVNLRGVNFSDVDLSFARLEHAVLADADCSKADMRGVRMERVDFRQADFSGASFSGGYLERCDGREVEMSQAVFTSTRMERCDFRKARFEKANFTHSHLLKLDMRGCVLDGCQMVRAQTESLELSEASAVGCDLRESIFFDVNLRGAVFDSADLDASRLAGGQLASTSFANSSFRGASLHRAKCRRASFRAANFRGSDLRHADLRNADLRDCNVAGVRTNRWALYRGIRLDGAYGSPQFVRLAKDQEYLEEIRGESWSAKYILLYLPWLLSSDCGRSLGLWAGWSLALALGFGVKFWELGPEHFEFAYLEYSLSTMLYYSVVTFTTLGFGDVIPKTQVGAMWVTFEVIVGYMMLGGLISIFANKLARRS